MKLPKKMLHPSNRVAVFHTMSQFQRGDLVRLKMTGDVFEVVEVFATGMVTI